MLIPSDSLIFTFSKLKFAKTTFHVLLPKFLLTQRFQHRNNVMTGESAIASG
ncbi:hypothetical protein JOY44_09520 [Phormidium sp. CLA17]|uniref:hypothetical protein n=1 Tax=Leptolyngbya sp. Cla-17 TaxID=2803751 RepID=UPI0019323C09|nr:hypothetical protein [Leptolyngbya sp. Cla-17]MBM0741858.1 hypothetical protein [Leptolyngbya sp. Cla-17]